MYFMSNQHIQVPVMEINQSLLFGDPYVYACIKRYMNKDTKQAFPSIQTLIKDSGLNKKTILAAIDRLEDNNYIKIIRRSGASNIYVFNEYQKFEIFSYEFLDISDLSPKAKSYLVILQHEMKKDPTHLIGTVEYNRTQLSDKLGISQPTLRKIEDELTAYGALTITPSNTLELFKDPNTGQVVPLTGLKNSVRTFNFSTILNTIALTFLEHEKEIKETKTAVADLREDFTDLREENKELKEENKELKEQLQRLVKDVDQIKQTKQIIL